MFSTILTMIIVGAIAGFVARLLVSNDGVSVVVASPASCRRSSIDWVVMPA